MPANLKDSLNSKDCIQTIDEEDECSSRSDRLHTNITAIKRSDSMERMESRCNDSGISDYRDTDPRRADQIITKAQEIYLADASEQSAMKSEYITKFNIDPDCPADSGPLTLRLTSP